MTDLSTITDAPIDTFISVLSLTRAEMEDILDDESEPNAKRLLVALLKSDKPEVVLNTLKWITDQIEIQKSAMPLPISEQITTYGEIGYTTAQIIALHPESATQISKDFKSKGDLYQAYHKGIALGKYKIDAQLHEKACKGDLKAIEMINIRKMLK